MALLYTSPPALPVHRRLRPLDPLPLLTPTRLVRHRFLFLCPNPSPFLSGTRAVTRGFAGAGLAAFRLCEHETLPPLNLDSLVIKECESDDELMAAVRLRVRTFYVELEQSSGSDDQRRDLEEREFSALKDRIDGKRIGFKRVSCINATLPSSASLVHADELCTECKFSQNGEDRVVVASLDINQCLKLADELTGKRPEAPGAGVVRAYLSNVCVAEELQRNGLGYAIVAKSKAVAHSWGINDLYVHVAVDNEAAKRLYSKSGFVYENEEPTWQARFLGRPRRLLLWADLSQISS